MDAANSNFDAEELALRAMVWTLTEPVRALRLLETTGLTPQDMRTRASDPAVLVASLNFLEAHEPDLIECAATLGIPPAQIPAARSELEAR